MRQNVIFIPTILGDAGVSTNSELLFNSRTKELFFSTNALRPTKNCWGDEISHSYGLISVSGQQKSNNKSNKKEVKVSFSKESVKNLVKKEEIHMAFWFQN